VHHAPEADVAEEEAGGAGAGVGGGVLGVGDALGDGEELGDDEGLDDWDAGGGEEGLHKLNS
jgi:hypothetical protein